MERGGDSKGQVDHLDGEAFKLRSKCQVQQARGIAQDELAPRAVEQCLKDF